MIKYEIYRKYIDKIISKKTDLKYAHDQFMKAKREYLKASVKVKSLRKDLDEIEDSMVDLK